MLLFFAVLAVHTSTPWLVLCEKEMKRKMMGKLNGEPFKLPASGGSREEPDEVGNDEKSQREPE